MLLLSCLMVLCLGAPLDSSDTRANDKKFDALWRQVAESVQVKINEMKDAFSKARSFAQAPNDTVEPKGPSEAETSFTLMKSKIRDLKTLLGKSNPSSLLDKYRKSEGIRLLGSWNDLDSLLIAELFRHGDSTVTGRSRIYRIPIYIQFSSLWLSLREDLLRLFPDENRDIFTFERFDSTDILVKRFQDAETLKVDELRRVDSLLTDSVTHLHFVVDSIARAPSPVQLAAGGYIFSRDANRNDVSVTLLTNPKWSFSSKLVGSIELITGARWNLGLGYKLFCPESPLILLVGYGRVKADQNTSRTYDASVSAFYFNDFLPFGVT
jgi:hypothetical protein